MDVLLWGSDMVLWGTLLGCACVAGGVGVLRRVMNGVIGGIDGVERMICLVIGAGYGGMLGRC